MHDAGPRAPDTVGLAGSCHCVVPSGGEGRAHLRPGSRAGRPPTRVRAPAPPATLAPALPRARLVILLFLSVNRPTAAGDLASELVRHFLIECTPKGVRLKGCSNEPYFGEWLRARVGGAGVPVSPAPSRAPPPAGPSVPSPALQSKSEMPLL